MSSGPSSSTGIREKPVRAERATTSAAEEPRSTEVIRTRGVIRSEASNWENRRVRSSRVASSASSSPAVAEWRIRKLSSSALRAPLSSSCGSTPIARISRLAVLFKNTTTGLNTVVNRAWNGTTALAVASGSASAKFFGTSSPITIENTVASSTPTTAPMAGTAPSGTPSPPSGDSSSELTAGSKV